MDRELNEDIGARERRADIARLVTQFLLDGLRGLLKRKNREGRRVGRRRKERSR